MSARRLGFLYYLLLAVSLLGSVLVNLIFSTSTAVLLQQGLGDNYNYNDNDIDVWLSSLWNKQNQLLVSSSTSTEDKPHQEDDDKDDDDLHNSSVATLDLLPWEIASVEQPNGACDTPEGVDQVCCLGTAASRAKMKDRYLCSHVTLQELQKTKQRALQYAPQRLLQEHTSIENSRKAAPACDVCRVVEVLRQRNYTLAFLGDSSHYQMARGFMCELQRRKYKVVKETLPTRPGDGHRNFRAHERLHISSPLWHNDTTVIVEILFQYKLPFIHDQERNIALTQFDVLVINFGLHWNYRIRRGDKISEKWNKDNYQPMVTTLFEQIRNAGRVQLLMHRESQATHFDAAGGDYSLALEHYGRIDDSKCVPLVENFTAYPTGWRERAVRQAAMAANYTPVVIGEKKSHHLDPSSANARNDELVILPYYDFTATLWDQHPRFYNWQEKSIDCLHFCGNPYLFLPIWTGIRLAMDCKFGEE